MLDEQMVRSIGRFVDLVALFGDRIASVYFVSNTGYDEVTSASTDARRRAKCPPLFLEHIRGCTAESEIGEPFIATFESLRASCACEANLLYRVLRRMDLIKGPPRDEFPAVVAHDHVGSLPECQGYDRLQLAAVTDDLVALVGRASSLHVADPNRHLHALLEGVTPARLTEGSGAQPQDDPISPPDTLPDPVLTAKRITAEEIGAYLRGADRLRNVVGSSSSATSRDPERREFQFPGQATVALGDERPQSSSSVLRQKLERGGFDGPQKEDFSEKERAAEAHLIKNALRWPEDHPRLLRQLEGMVLGECREAYLRNASRATGTGFGVQMLIEVQDRLRALARDRPHMVGQQEYECLMGVAALLTADCRVWWSERFVLEVDAA